MTLQLPEGFTRFSPEQYHSDTTGASTPTLSRSIAHTLLEKSPLHAWAEHPRLGNIRRRPATDEMDLGTLVHKLVLGNGTDYAVGDYDDWRAKAAREWRDEIRAEGKIAILRKDADRAQEVVESLFDTLSQRRLTWLLEGETELGMTWQEPVGNDTVTWRGMMDVYKEVNEKAMIVDLKTSSFAHPRSLPSSFVKFGYDLQDAVYTRGVEVLRPELAGRVEFLFVFVETYKPYAVTIVEMSEMFKAIGRAKYDRAVKLWHRCLSTDNWPGYGEQIHQLEPPAWLLNQAMALNVDEEVQF